MAETSMTQQNKDIRKARDRIEDLFLQHCLHGTQTSNLENKAAAACGQFIGETAKDLGQRGMHGTTAALGVLAQTEEQQGAEVTERLVYYLANREALELKCRPEDTDGFARQWERDSRNVIKLSETLYSLSFVKQGTCETSALVVEIADKLVAGIQEEKGYRYFLEDGEPQLLPSAYALVGLAAHGYKETVQQIHDFLFTNLCSRYDKPSVSDYDYEAVAIDIACLYALTFRNRPQREAMPDPDLKQVFKKIWRLKKHELVVDQEQNVEYWLRNSRTCYVRIPWQIYLLALTSHYGFTLAFSSAVAQTAIKRLTTKVCNGGFVYPHSGRETSARTNAILYEVFGRIIEVTTHRKPSLLPRLPELYWNVARSRWAKIGISLAALVVVVLAIHDWVQKSDTGWADLGPEVAGDFLTICVGLMVLPRSLRK